MPIIETPQQPKKRSHKSNEFKYRWRAGLKEGNALEQDIAKAKWYEAKARELREIKNIKV